MLELESFAEAALALQRTDSDPEGVGIMTRKARVFPVRLEGVSLKASPLLKQELLAAGGDASHAKGVADLSVEQSDVVLLATFGQYLRIIPKLRRQPFQLAAVADALEQALRNYTHQAPRTIRGVHRSFVVGERTLVMGVVNVTPDSFSDGGSYAAPREAVDHALELEREGADVIDIGGESTHPGATPVTPDREWSRLGPVIAELHGRVHVPLSVDTRHAEVAKRALEAGADLVNDVDGLRDGAMRRVVAESGAPALLMHMRGTPTTMQEDLEYRDVRSEVYGWLADATARAVGDGVSAEQILVDPGLGFGKSAEQNLEILGHLGEFRSLGFPVVVGASRKSFLAYATGASSIEERREAGLAAAVLAARAGAHMVRVHEVAATVRAVRLVDAVRKVRRDIARAGEAAANSPDPD